MKCIAKKGRYQMFELEKPLDYTNETDSKRYTEARYLIKGAEDDIYVMFQENDTSNEYILTGFCFGGLCMPIMNRNLHEEIMSFIKEALNQN